MITKQEVSQIISTNPFDQPQLQPLYDKGLEAQSFSLFAGPNTLHAPDLMQSNQERLSELQDKLNTLVNNLALNQSYLSRIVSFWGERPLWQKIITGSVLAIPSLVLGIVANIWFLIGISIFTLVAYTLVSLMLDNHFSHTIQTQEGLKEGIASLGSVLITVIESLEIIKTKFSQEIDEIACQNQKLKHSVDTLQQKVVCLTINIESLQQTEISLRAISSALDLTTQELTQSLEQQTLLMKVSQEELHLAQETCQTTKNELIEKVAELEVVKKEMTLKISQFQSIGLTLQGALESMSHTVIADKTHRLHFQEKLQNFLENKEASFDKIVERICEAEHKLVVVSNELNFSNQRYKELLDKQDKHLSRLESLHDIKPQSTQINQQDLPTNALNQLGIFAVPNLNILEKELVHYQAVLSAC